MAASSETTPGSFIWFLRKVPIFEELTESLYLSADARAKQIAFRRGDVLTPETQPLKQIFVVVEGQVKLRSFAESGKEQIIDILGPGDVYGPIERVTNPATRKDASVGSLATEAVALSQGHALGFDVQYFQHLVQQRPTVALNLSRFLGARQRRLEIRLRRLLFRSSLGKVAGLLCELAERYGEKTPEGHHKIDFRLRHQEMASIVGTKRETVSESLAELEYRELIRAKSGVITIFNVEALDQIN